MKEARVVRKTRQVVVLECLNCGHEWVPRVVESKECPSCKSRLNPPCRGREARK